MKTPSLKLDDFIGKRINLINKPSAKYPGVAFLSIDPEDEIVREISKSWASVRWKLPGNAYTQDMVPGRLNVLLSNEGEITGFKFG